MSAIVEGALYGFGIKFALIFLIVPLGILFAGYLAFIIIESLRELNGIKKQRQSGKKEETVSEETR